VISLNTNERLIRILCAGPVQLAAIDQILEGPIGGESVNDASARESATVKAVAAAIEKPALPTPPEVECYIDKAELARRLGRTVRSVDTYMAEGIVPFYKLGRTVAFKWSEVDAYLQSHYRVGARGRRQVLGAA
jgi:predicted DNA-binding transcriptional regulator AlpA